MWLVSDTRVFSIRDRGAYVEEKNYNLKNFSDTLSDNLVIRGIYELFSSHQRLTVTFGTPCIVFSNLKIYKIIFALVFLKLEWFFIDNWCISLRKLGS